MPRKPTGKPVGRPQKRGELQQRAFWRLWARFLREHSYYRSHTLETALKNFIEYRRAEIMRLGFDLRTWESARSTIEDARKIYEIARRRKLRGKVGFIVKRRLKLKEAKLETFWKPELGATTPATRRLILSGRLGLGMFRTVDKKGTKSSRG